VGDIVTISGTVEVLGGEPCHQLNNLTLRLGKRDHTKVLDLALAKTHVGDEIWIVSPSSLAYGIKGISGCITSRTPVLYKIKILKTNE
jgi:FKBP-type peptidyl-prolyl cis-trans isomerase